ncbi:DUF6906 family protein [Thomasclavelia ramosa]|uniref:DUF6906 domain-containing protein n=1 Tax=Thomasclavelia ramosa TaxID=1547 RepID=A0AB35ING8_9FIRM|nr:hypothetical protein [Thomasclavelia ramosa]MDB7084939.1 hypothetical protein [Thomasclavelia ramosa]
MKQAKKLTVAMKKLINKNSLNPNDYWFIKNTCDQLVIIHKKTNKIIKIAK